MSDMDLNAAMETFAEAWVAANTPTAINPDPKNLQQSTLDASAPSPIDDYAKPSPSDLPSHPPICPKLPLTASLSGKSIPVHCLIETTASPQGFEGGGGNVELDSYAIMPNTTLFSEIVRTALIKLGYSPSEVMGAKGAVQIKNWKPLTFDMITDNPELTVEDILGDLTPVATIRIKLCREQTTTWDDSSVRCAVIELLKEMNQSQLAKQSPLSQSVISNIANSKYSTKLSAEKCKEFGNWYKDRKTSTSFTEGLPKDARMTFHPIYEVPQLRKWYQHCKNPTDETLWYYLNELNKGPVRSDRPKLTLQKVKIWWKNERQKEKKVRQKLPKPADDTSDSDL